MAKKIRVPDSVFPAIALMATHAEKLPLIRAVIDGLEASKQTPFSIAAAFASKANIPDADASKIITQALSFQDLRIGFGITTRELFDAVTDSLESVAPADWKANNIAKWKSSRAVIEQLAEPSHPLNIVFKGVRLAYEHQNVLYSSTVITDIRPVFDDAAKDVKRMTIAHVLEIDFHDGQKRRKLFATMDAEDVANLKKACERAETKAATLKDKLKVLPWPIVVSGESDDD